ncbi:MAG: S-adenosylmethionine:tRNA ribosyltransferase-isomerase [Christensenellales bacterium]
MQQGMKTSDYRYDLPEELIAQTPILRRDQARLMVLPKTGPVQHRVFTDIESYLSAGDVLVVNKQLCCRRAFGPSGNHRRAYRGAAVKTAGKRPLGNAGAPGGR